MSKNRFAVLELDDDDDQHKEQCITFIEPVKVMNTNLKPVTPVAKKIEVREWKIKEETKGEVRQWHVDTPPHFKQNKKHKPFLRGYAFKDDNMPERRVLRGYSFKDDYDDKKQQVPPPPTPINKDIDFPKLNNYEPATKEATESVQTFAEKVKKAMETKLEVKEPLEAAVKPDQHIIHMYNTIPMKTTISDSIQFLS